MITLRQYLNELEEGLRNPKDNPCWKGYHPVGTKKKNGRTVPNCVPTNEAANWKQQAAIAISMKKAGKKPKNEDIEASFDLIEYYVMNLAEELNVDPETIWEKFEEIDDEELLEAAVDAKGYKSSTGGLTQKGRDHYNAQSGGHLKAPVTTKPSKLKPGSKAANRRKSFCARMGGVEGPMKKPNGEPTRKALALRKWNC